MCVLNPSLGRPFVCYARARRLQPLVDVSNPYLGYNCWGRFDENMRRSCRRVTRRHTFQPTARTVLVHMSVCVNG